jgi:hypothetical protein
MFIRGLILKLHYEGFAPISNKKGYKLHFNFPKLRNARWRFFKADEADG